MLIIEEKFLKNDELVYIAGKYAGAGQKPSSNYVAILSEIINKMYPKNIF